MYPVVSESSTRRYQHGIKQVRGRIKVAKGDSPSARLGSAVDWTCQKKPFRIPLSKRRFLKEKGKRVQLTEGGRGKEGKNPLRENETPAGRNVRRPGIRTQEKILSKKSRTKRGVQERLPLIRGIP